LTAANGGTDAARIGRPVNINIRNKREKKKSAFPAPKTTVRSAKNVGIGAFDKKIGGMRKKNGR